MSRTEGFGERTFVGVTVPLEVDESRVMRGAGDGEAALALWTGVVLLRFAGSSWEKLAEQFEMLAGFARKEAAAGRVAAGAQGDAQ